MLRALCPLLPLSCSVETSGAATQVASVGVGAAVDAGARARRALVHVMTAARVLLVVKARRTDALEAAQSVEAGGRTTNGAALTLVFICREQQEMIQDDEFIKEDQM